MYIIQVNLFSRIRQTYHGLILAMCLQSNNVNKCLLLSVEHVDGASNVVADNISSPLPDYFVTQ